MGSNTLMSAAVLGGGINPFMPGRSIDELWVDQAGSNDYGLKSLSLDRPLATITRAIALAAPTAGIFNRSTIIHVAPGQYRELVDVNKPDIAIIGGSGRYPGRTRIVGDGTTVQATVRVHAPFLRGFVLANLFVETGFPGTTSVAAPAIMLETSDDQGGDNAELGANHQNYHFLLDNIQVESDGIPTAALLMAGASFGRVTNSIFAGCLAGIVFSGSRTPLNNSVSVKFRDCSFYNNVTADVATSSSNPPTINIGSPVSLDSISFRGCQFEDTGGTPVTNFINMAGGTHVNVGFYDCFFNRDIADGTLVQTPAGTNIVGCWSPAGAESFIGA